MSELLLLKAFEAIEDIYKRSNDEAKMIAVCLKLLLRCKRMFEAKQDVTRILKLIAKREQLADTTLKNKAMNKEQLIAYYDILLSLSAKIYQYIIRLQNEFRVLKRPFVFNLNNYLI